MRIFITRHGQVADDADYLGDVAYPKGDIPLSPLGREQARLLGERLKNEGFSGVIYSSPFMRTMETAEIIAVEVGAKIIPTPAFHEIFRAEDTVRQFVGKNLAELRRSFSGIAENVSMPQHWWATKAESAEDVRFRVAIALTEIMSDNTEDVLLVGHGASLSAMCAYLLGGDNLTPFYNCSYTLYDSETKRMIRNDSSHLKIDKMTYNRVPFLEKERSIDVGDELLSDSGVRVLHIGDTVSTTYNWYLSLVNKVMPDVIIHTGDTADEMKVSRDISIREKYCDRAGAFLRALCKRCKRVIWVPGNNDIEQEMIKLAPDIEVVKPGTIIEISGSKLSLAHEKKDLAIGGEINFYGHSPRYETWSCERNLIDGEYLYFNALWKLTVLSLPSKKFYYIERPDSKNF